MITQKMVNQATASSVWDTGNKVLYDMCSKYPSHKVDEEIIAKIWLIGRSYAAAIERRKPSEEDINQEFYTSKVVPLILKSNIDELLEPLKKYKTVTKHNFNEILEVHYHVTKLFSNISGMSKRSLASKYLHFHHPRLFFIYDSRACAGMRNFMEITGRSSRSEDILADKEYRKLSEKSLALRSFVKLKYGVMLTPRQMDNLLLNSNIK